MSVVRASRKGGSAARRAFNAEHDIATEEENFRLFDFTLTEGDMAEISALERDERTGFDPDRYPDR
ncbi:hypothetical protein [Streptomyces liangshanensis]